MGIISQGILGAISGKVGNVIGASWRGIPYLRIKPASVANPRTVAQVDQRNKFTATQTFVRAMKSFINIGYKFFQNKMTPANAASSYILKNAIAGSSPDFSVDYANALVSRGSLPGIDSPVASISGGDLNLEWTDNTGVDQALGSDKLIIGVFSDAAQSGVVIQEEAIRSTGNLLYPLPDHLVGGPVELFLAFESADGRYVSDSYHEQVTPA